MLRGLSNTAAIELDVVHYRCVQGIGALPSLVVAPGNAEVVSPLLKAPHLPPHTNCTRQMQSACDVCAVYTTAAVSR